MHKALPVVKSRCKMDSHPAACKSCAEAYTPILKMFSKAVNAKHPEQSYNKYMIFTILSLLLCW